MTTNYMLMMVTGKLKSINQSSDDNYSIMIDKQTTNQTIIAIPQFSFRWLKRSYLPVIFRLLGLVVVVDWNWNSRLIHCSLSVVYHATLSIYSYRNSIFWYSFERNAKCENNSMLFSTFNFVWIKKQRCLPSSRPYSIHIHLIRKESQAIFQFASPTSYNIQLHSGIFIIKQSIVARIIIILDKCVMSFIQC